MHFSPETVVHLHVLINCKLKYSLQIFRSVDFMHVFIGYVSPFAGSRLGSVFGWSQSKTIR